MKFISGTAEVHNGEVNVVGKEVTSLFNGLGILKDREVYKREILTMSLDGAAYNVRFPFQNCFIHSKV